MVTDLTIAAARERATRTAANLNVEHGFVFFEQAVKRAVNLDWLIVVEIDGDSTTRIEHYGLKIPALTLHVCTLGEPSTRIIGKTGRLCDI